jgi:hypothetical protein
MTLHFLEFYSVDKPIGFLKCRTHDVGCRDFRVKNSWSSSNVESRCSNDHVNKMTKCVLLVRWLTSIFTPNVFSRSPTAPYTVASRDQCWQFSSSAETREPKSPSGCLAIQPSEKLGRRSEQTDIRSQSSHLLLLTLKLILNHAEGSEVKFRLSSPAKLQ